MADRSTAPPTPYSQFCLFKSLSYSLYEYDWYNFVEQWQAMVAVNAPVHEFTYNLAPFFSNAKRLMSVFHRYMNFVHQDPEFLNTMTNVLMSTPLMIKVQDILHSEALFHNYVAALKLDNPSASHTQVMQAIQSFLATLPAPTRLRVQRAFAEAEASDSLGLSGTTLETAFQLLNSDVQLYIDFLTTLQLNQTRNMPWDTVVSKIRAIITAKQPYAWSNMDYFLKQLHYGHFQAPSHYGYGQEVDFYDGDYYSGSYADDDIMEKVEGVDYHRNEQDEREFEAIYGSESFVSPTTNTQTKIQGQSQEAVVDKFSKMSVTDKRPTIA
ncbi:hypothetical protein BX616_003569 [Lobosporangium transversale]|uniref:Uncharacterized protein n=1 Tax=Lobosporangium transversale TaxID=64571 RepID=A0A1Y2GXL9_9FUNG|nr:hypothetical protein BCR41DRAFT_384800 [Lobosporangium transversale]KAF9898825.1 hypothetical protein BX616_003569 [Lobosporangium transversale]ORZ25007.1 hypothetical protein BCR41DRAFT_384800 [Lobosporangium transversale]|eukprot:XP_021883988.1 hypothetical protein BCR41DRAFT_384800 [Lobosporangium transversale]